MPGEETKVFNRHQCELMSEYGADCEASAAPAGSLLESWFRVCWLLALVCPSNIFQPPMGLHDRVHRNSGAHACIFSELRPQCPL